MNLTFNMADPEERAIVRRMLAAAEGIEAVPDPAEHIRVPAEVQAPAEEAPEVDKPPSTAAATPRAMTKAKELAKEHGIDWRTLFPGSGKDGMVRQDDVQKAIKAKKGNGKGAPKTDAEPKTDGPTFAQVRNALSGYVQQAGPEAAVDFLRRFGVERVSALDPSQYDGVMHELSQLAEAG